MALLYNDENYYPENLGGNQPDNSRLGYYQYITFDDLVNNFMFSKTGEGMLLGNVNRNLVAFHIQRCIQELNYDVLRVTKSLQVELNPNTRSVALPQDFVNMVQVAWLDGAGNKHPMIHAETEPGQSPVQQDDYSYLLNSDGNLIQEAPSTAVDLFQNPVDETQNEPIFNGYYYGAGLNDNEYPYSGGYFSRYGLNPQRSNANGFYVLDAPNGMVYFNDTVLLVDPMYVSIDYISDGLGDGANIQVNKLVEAAVYKMTEKSILEDKFGVQDYIIRRVKKEADAMERNAKIRLMNLNFEELGQTLRGQNVWIKH